MASPSVVTNLQVVSLLSNRQFIVSWNQNPELNIASYNIYRSEAQFDGFGVVGAVSKLSTQFIDTVPFTFGINFFWKVTAVDSLGNESDLNNSSSVSDISIGAFDDEPFKQVIVQKQDLIFYEQPLGLLNGANTTFTTIFPFRHGTLQLIRDHEMEIPGDFTEFMSGSGFTVSSAPAVTESFLVNYVKFFS